MNFEQAKEKIKEGHEITRSGWDSCKIIRTGKDTDADYINYDVTGLIVESCEKRICDCKIAIFRPTPEDEAANDYIIAT